MKPFYRYREHIEANEAAINKLLSAPLYTPQELYQKLEELGYRGQERARKAMCVAAYRHFKRVKKILSGEKKNLPPKTNYLLMGPTGCGKTYIIELLFGKILKLPYVIIDITKYSETGYVGESVLNIPYKLIEAAHGNVLLAKFGVVAIDEFDKIAGCHSNIRFAGAGTTKDVSGYGVQRELLKLVEGSKVSYGRDDLSLEGHIDTSNILFFAIGAFSGFLTHSVKKEIGFLKEIKSVENKIAYEIDQYTAEDVTKFQSYGFLPELIARFQRIIVFEPLDKKTLKEILHLKLKEVKNEFQEEGFEIRITPRAEDFIVEEAVRRQTGARAIESVIMRHLEEMSFEIFGQQKEGKIIVDVKNGELNVKIKSKRGGRYVD